MKERLFRPLGMKNTVLPASTSNSIPKPYSHGYLYGSSSVALRPASRTPIHSGVHRPRSRPAQIQPNDYTGVNHSFATAAGGAISTADDLDTWIRALVGGRVLNAKYQRLWRDSLGTGEPQQSLDCMGTASANFAGDPTPSISMAARLSATTRRRATTRQQDDARGVDQSDRVAS